MPPLSSHNRYACLVVDQCEDATSVFDCAKVVPQPSPSPKKVARIHLANWERRLPKKFIIAMTPSENSLNINVEIETTDTVMKCNINALVDCGATSLFVDTEYVRSNNISTHRLTTPIPVYNVDGTANEAGAITEIADVILRYKGHAERTQLAVTSLGKQTMILGFTWLREQNPEIDWQTKEVRMSRCPPQCSTCRAEVKVKHQAERAATAQIHACRAGSFLVLIEEIADEDDYPSMGLGEPEGGVTDFDDGFDDEIEDSDRIFVAHIHGEDAKHFVRAASTVSQRLAEAFTKNSKATSFRDAVPSSLHEFEDVFSEGAFDHLPKRRKWDHAIELEHEPLPGFRKVYPMSPKEQRELDAFLEEALATGRIRHSKLPIGAPVFFIKKKDGKLHFVQDYRALNLITRKNRYPLPLIDDLIHRLKGAKYFTKLDVRWGYNNVRIKEGDEWKAAFRTNRGLFEPLVMYFGLTNSPATFQTMMNKIFEDLITQGVVSIYLDDILIFTSTLEEHRPISRMVMERLRSHKLYLRHEKCKFEKTRIEYLGVIISHNKVEMGPVKIAGVSEWPTPTNKKEVQSFVGFINFYQRFILNFSQHAHPLFDLTMKDIRFIWGLPQEDAFMMLKGLVTSAPILALPDSNLPYRLEADTSRVATGAVLSQQSCEDSKWHPVSFLSKVLSPVEHNYEIHDIEMLAIIRGFEEWHHYLEGARHPIEVLTDHKNLKYFRVVQKLNHQQARWSLYLSRFDFTLQHKPGTSMGKPDALLRRADHGCGQNDNDNMTLLLPELFHDHVLSAIAPVGPERNIRRSL